jgi:hypothetical protein
MWSARALLLLGIVATTGSAAGLVVVVVVLFDHSAHPPHVDADLLLGVLGLILGFAALGESLNLLLVGIARRKVELQEASGAGSRP